jgi:predicted transcriptional regulator of viral defense system
MGSTDAQFRQSLGPVFRWSEAQEAGMADPRLYRLMREGAIERIGHGLYRWTDAEIEDLDLIEIAASAPQATLCLTTALARHDLTDEIPTRIDVAVPRGARVPKIAAPVMWHKFNAETFEIGRETLPLAGGLQIGLYGPERTIIDVYRLRHIEGVELGRDALKQWLRRRGTQPAVLLRMAESFPKVVPQLRADLQVLL